MNRYQIVASVLGADYMRLGEELAELEAAGVDGVQWDIMDGRFVPNLTFGADVVAAGRRVVGLPFEAHLMIEEPARYAEAFVRSGAHVLTFHWEVAPAAERATKTSSPAARARRASPGPARRRGTSRRGCGSPDGGGPPG